MWQNAPAFRRRRSRSCSRQPERGHRREGEEARWAIARAEHRVDVYGLAELPKIIREKNAEGVLFMRHTYPKLIKEIQSLRISVVAVDDMPRVKGINSTQVDNEHGGGRGGSPVSPPTSTDRLPESVRRAAQHRRALAGFVWASRRTIATSKQNVIHSVLRER
jgi:hypothetical protein